MDTLHTPFETKEHENLRAEVAEFATSHIAPEVSGMEESRRVHHELPRKIAKEGYLGVTIPRKYGGTGQGHLAKTLVIEEISRVSGAMGAMVQASMLGVAKILHFGNARQKARWLPRIASGDILPTIAVTEPESGGHVLGMAGNAVRKGNEYVINGSKVWVGNSDIGDLHGVVVRTGEGSRGLSAFLIEHTRPGFIIGDEERMMGLHGFSFGKLLFDDCRIPASSRLGKEGDGLAVAYSSSILYGRPNLTAVALGIHQALVDATAIYVRDTQRYGSALLSLENVRQTLGAMASRLLSSRILAYDAVSRLDRGLSCDRELMNAKLHNVEAVLDSARDAMEMFGAAALSTRHPIERYLRDAHHILPPAGTNAVQRLRLADGLIGPQRPGWSERFATEGKLL